MSGTALQMPADTSARTVATYRADGIVALDVPADVRELQSDFLAQCCRWLNALAHVECAPVALPQALTALARTDRGSVARLYKIARRFPAAKALAAHPWFVSTAATLMGTRLVSCCHFVNVRIDLPAEDAYLLPLHQDFPYIQGSFNGLTVWLPFHDTPLEAGPPAWIAGSHTAGVQPVRERRYGDGPIPSGGRSFELAAPERCAAAELTSQAVPFGRALVFDTRLVHRSQINRSPHARVNIQLRYDDALAIESFERNYPEGLYLGDAFVTSYPEYVRNDDHA